MHLRTIFLWQLLEKLKWQATRIHHYHQLNKKILFLLLYTNQELSSMITLFLKAAQNHLLTTKGFYFMAKTMTRTLSWRLFITLLDFEVVPRVFWSWRHLRSFICCLLQYSNLAEKGNPCENIHQRWWKDLSESKKKIFQLYLRTFVTCICVQKTHLRR